MDKLFLILFILITIKFSKKSIYLPDGTKKTFIRKSNFPLILIGIVLLYANIQQKANQPGSGLLGKVKNDILLQFMQLGGSLMVLLIALAGFAIMAFKRGTSMGIIRWLLYAFLIFIFFVGIISFI